MNTAMQLCPLIRLLWFLRKNDFVAGKWVEDMSYEYEINNAFVLSAQNAYAKIQTLTHKTGIVSYRVVYKIGNTEEIESHFLKLRGAFMFAQGKLAENY